MAILRDCELWHCRLDPERPNAKYNKENPTWEAQIRTTVKEQKDEWVAEGLKVKVAMDKEDETKFLYWYVNLRKKSIKSDGDAGGPVKVIDGELKEVNPNSIGNGSRGNVRLFQYNHPNGTASVLMGI